MTVRHGLALNASIAAACVALTLLASACDSSTSSASSPVPATAASASLATLPQMPLGAAPGANGKVLVPVTAGAGPATLPDFTPSAGRIYVEVACLGPGAVQVDPIMTVEPCTATGVFTNQIDGFKGQLLQLKVRAEPGTRWEVLVTEGLTR